MNAKKPIPTPAKVPMKSFAELLDSLEADPLSSIVGARRLYGSGRQKIYQAAAIAYGYFLRVKYDEDQRKKLYTQLRHAGRIYEPNLSKLMVHVFQFIEAGDTQAGEHARSMSVLLYRQPRLEPKDIPAYLTGNGGFSGLLKGDGDEDESNSETAEDERPRGSRGSSPSLELNGAGGKGFSRPASKAGSDDPFDGDEVLAPHPKGSRQKGRPDPAKVGERTLQPLKPEHLGDWLFVESDSEEKRDAVLNVPHNDELDIRIKRLADSTKYAAPGGSGPLKRFRLVKVLS